MNKSPTLEAIVSDMTEAVRATWLALEANIRSRLDKR
jgi:hypothetical protein